MTTKLPRELDQAAPLPPGLFRRLEHVAEKEHWGNDYIILRKLLALHYKQLHDTNGFVWKNNGEFIMNTSLLSDTSLLPVVLLFTPVAADTELRLPYGPPTVLTHRSDDDGGAPEPPMAQWPVWNNALTLRHSVSRVLNITRKDLPVELQDWDRGRLKNTLERAVEVADDRRRREHTMLLACICSSGIKWLLPFNITSARNHVPDLAFVITQADDVYRITDVWPLDYAYMYARVASRLQHTWLRAPAAAAATALRKKEEEERGDDDNDGDDADNSSYCIPEDFKRRPRSDSPNGDAESDNKRVKQPEKCRDFAARGKCRFGDNCWFLH